MNKWDNPINTLSKITIICLFSSVLLFARVTLKHPVLKMKIPDKWKTEPVVIVSDSLALELNKGKKHNTLTVKDVKWFKINKSSGGELKTLYEDYYLGYEIKPSVKIEVIYKGDKIKRIFNIETINDTLNKYSLFEHKDNNRYLKISIPDYSKIKYLRIETVHTFNKIMWQNHYPIRHRYYNTLNKYLAIIWPTGFTLNYGVENKEALNITTNITTRKGKNVFYLNTKEIGEMEGEDKYKFPELWYSALFVSFPPKGYSSFSWEQMGQYYFDMIYDSLSKKDTSIIDSIASSIPGPTNEEVIKNTFDYVKNNIRYYGSWEKFYGLIPRGPKEVLEKGYGDCKEMANLLSMLLRKKGINASVTLVRRNKDYYFKFNPKYPTLGLSDHLITCVERKNGTHLFLDATTKNATHETSYLEYLNQPVLIVNSKGPYLDTVQPGLHYESKITTDSKFRQFGMTKWMLEGTVTLQGEIAYNLYMRLQRSGNANKDKIVDYFLKRLLKSRPEKSKLTKQSPKKVIITYEKDISENVLTSPVKGLIFSIPAIYTPNSSYSDLSHVGDRYLSKISQSDTWEYPHEFKALNTSNLNSSLGIGEWTSLENSINGRRVARKYYCNFSFVKVTERDKLKTFLSERSNFARGIAWSENPK